MTCALAAKASASAAASPRSALEICFFIHPPFSVESPERAGACGSYKKRHSRSRGVTRPGIGALIKSGSKRPKIVFKELSKNFQKRSMGSQLKRFYDFDRFTLDASERTLMR